MNVRRNSSAAYKRHRRENRRRQWKRMVYCLLSIALLGIFLRVMYAYRKADFFPITTVHLFVSQPYMDTTGLKQLISHALKGNFFTASLNLIIKTLLTDDAIQSIHIDRTWPNALSIHVNGYEPVAFLNQDSLITATGHIFKMPKGFAMPLNVSLAGPTDQAITMVNLVQLFNDMLRSLHLTVKSMKLSENMLTQVTLSNGVHVMLGKDELKQRFIRFVNLYPKVIGRCAENALSVDLRYTNGLAVQWKHQGNDSNKCVRP